VAKSRALFILANPRSCIALQLWKLQWQTMAASTWLLVALTLVGLASPAAGVVTFPSGKLTLHGVLYKPNGKGPFPAVLYNHGSAPGMYSQEAFDRLGPLFAERGWVFFAP
jgi:dipeptidyl aminopeptidase/acylaminoacyl peptidase